MCPFPVPDGHDGPRLIDEFVPGLAAYGQDLLVGFEDPVREPVFAHELPDVLDRIELRGLGRQRQDRDVVRDLKLAAHMPAGPVHHQERMGSGGNLSRDFIEMQLHHGRVATGDDKTGADASLRTNRAEDPGRLGALILLRHRPASLARPPPCDLGFLADPSLVLPPDLYRCLRTQAGSESVELTWETFLKASSAWSFCP